MNNLNKLIIDEIVLRVNSSKTGTKYRTPLVGFADADNPFFKQLKTIISTKHYLPSDLLTGAKTVVTFFITFDEEIVYKNLKCETTSREWAYGKKDAQDLIAQIIEGMKVKLGELGIRCSGNPNKEPYIQEKFMHRWSLRHMAYICGLGNFGLNQLIITKSGCAGRLGSFVIDASVDYDEPVAEEYCLYKYNSSCGVCINNCPTEALTFKGIDKLKCNKWLNDNTNKYFGGDRAFKSCGKCIALPCALNKPKMKA